MADNEVVKTIENVDALFAQIVVNGEVHESSSYVAPKATTPSSQSQQTTVVEEEEELEATDGVGEDVYAVELNDTLHNFVDRAVGEALQNEIQTRGEADLQLHNSVVSLGQRVVQTESSVESLSRQVDTFGTELGNVEDLIPSQATDENQLADKDFVNSSIATNTANFLGTYTSLADITAIPNPTNNDYAFLQTVDTAGNTIYQRYKYSAQTSSWLFEYELNNSGFTAEQWATINSGLTQSLVNTAITNAINALDVSSTGGSGKYIESISEVDGKISAVEASIADTVTSGNVHSVSSDAVAEEFLKYLKLSGGTLMGEMTAVLNHYFINGQFGLNMNNSDIVGINGLYWGDAQDSGGEGIYARRSNNNYDNLEILNGLMRLKVNCDVKGDNGTSIPLTKWVDITSQVTLTQVSSLGTYRIGTKKFYMCGCMVKVTLTVYFDYNVVGGSTPLQLKISCPLFSTSKELSSTYASSYYSTGIWTVGLNVYDNENDVISFRPNQNFATGVDVGFKTIFAVNVKDVS